MLSNADLDSASPFAGILIGQPTLAARLRQGIFAALDQRISVRYTLGGMDLTESIATSRHHLAIAGRATRSSPMTPRAPSPLRQRAARASTMLPPPPSRPPPPWQRPRRRRVRQESHRRAHRNLTAVPRREPEPSSAAGAVARSPRSYAERSSLKPAQSRCHPKLPATTRPMAPADGPLCTRVRIAGCPSCDLGIRTARDGFNHWAYSIYDHGVGSPRRGRTTCDPTA